MIGEVSTADDSKCVPYIRDGGMDSVLNYPLYYTLKKVFSGASFHGLASHLAAQRNTYGAKAMGMLGNFASCHDLPRLPSVQPDAQLRKNWLLFTLAAEGNPLVYYGVEQAYHGSLTGDASLNREPLWTSEYRTATAADGMYSFIAAVNGLRRRMPRGHFADAVQEERYVSDDLYVFMRGQVVAAITNGGTRAPTRTQLGTEKHDQALF